MADIIQDVILRVSSDAEDLCKGIEKPFTGYRS